VALLDNLVSYWKLDESSGNASDSVGSNTLTNNNTVTYSSGKINNGAIITGSTQSLSISDASQTGLDITGNFSISLWWKTPSTIASATFIDKYNPGGGNNQRAYRLYYDLGTAKFWFDVSSDGTSGDSYDFSYSPSTSTWYHLVITWTASTKKGNWYVNGSALTEKTGTSVTSLFNSNATFIIGNGYGNNSPVNTIDEVGVWSRALSSTEVTALYNSGNGNQYPFSTAYTITASVTNYTLTGIDIGIKIARLLSTSVTAYTLTGIDILIKLGKGLIASVANFTITTVPANITSARHLTTAVTNYALTGVDIVITKAMTLTATTANYILTTFPAILKASWLKWTNQSKTSSTFTNKPKSSSSFTNQSKSSSSWTNQGKN
jgi:hypothetical protein